MIDPPGTAQTPEELNKLNTANTVSITYNNGNGQLNGALRIDYSDNDCDCAYVDNYDDIFYQDYHRFTFYASGIEYADGTTQPDINRFGLDSDVLHHGADD